MKLIILALFSLTVTVRSESSVKDQKDDNSAPYGKVLSPLYRKLNQEYVANRDLYSRNDGGIRNAEGYYNEDGYSRNVGLLRNIEGQYNNNGRANSRIEGRPRNFDGSSYYDDGNEEEYYRNGGGLSNIGGYSNNGYEGDYQNEGLLRNLEGRYIGEVYSRDEGRTRNLGGQSYGGAYQGVNLKNDGRLGNLGGSYYNGLNELIVTPVNMNDVATISEGHKKVQYYRLVGRTGLGFDKRTATSYGMMAPITASLLQVVRRNDFRDNRGQRVH